MSDIAGRIDKLSPTKRALLIERLRQSQKREAIITPRADRDAFPLSFAQRRMWFLHQLDPESAAYNMPALLRLRGRLNIGALHSSLQEILRRHDALRARFVTIRGQPEQVIEALDVVPLPLIALDHLPADEREMALERLVQEEARRPFDLGRAPLLRTHLLRLSSDEHALILVAHHIAADGWSINILLRELEALYTAFAEGKPSPLAPLALQYADYAAWQRMHLEERDVTGDGAPLSRRERQLAFWRAHLSDVPALELPTDHPRRLTQHVAGRQFAFALPDDAMAVLRTLAAQEGATPFMALLALFETLLARYSGQDLFAVGIPVAGRTHAELEPLVGCFVNTLALRADLSGAPAFRALLHRTRNLALAAYANQDLPFDLLIESLHPERERDRTPLIQVMFDLQREPARRMRIADLEVERTPIANGTTKFDLSFTALEDDGVLRGLFEYNADLFDADTIERMAGHLTVLLKGAVESPDCPITSLPLLTEAERRQILIEWNATSAPFEAERCIHDLFEDQVRRTPHALAVAFGDQSLTFDELNRRANQLAHLLRTRGVGPEVLVGLNVARSVDLIVGLLGILKAGGAYVPLDPMYPAQRLAWMIEDSQAPVIVTQQALEQGLPPTNATLIRLDADWDAIAAMPDDNPPRTTTACNLAYVIFTSGSTGRPKGVMIEHRSALNLAAALQRMIYDRYPHEHLRIALNAPLAFDASFQQIVMLIYGHTLDIVPQDIRLDGRALLAYLRECRIDGFDCVPSQLALLLDAGLLDGSGWTPRLSLPGGEAIDDHMWQTLARAPATDFFNMYGPTECTVDVTTICAREAPERATIGRPMLNVRAYILDPHQQPVPAGVPGELYIGGVCVGRGYLRRPDLTAERFIEIDDPVTGGKQRVYRTGDQCRFRRDGTIEYLGRLDQQVKIRGFRIEPGEVEAVLRTVAGVHSAAVVAWGEQSERRRLVAYVTPATVAPADVLRELRRVLPEYMTPAAIVPLDALPLTPNGKIDRRALPPPDRLRTDDDAYISPRTPLEQLLADIWRQVLDLERIGIDERFFALGGNSIQAAVLANRLHDALGVEAPVRLVFEAPTIAELAEALINRYPHLAQGNEPLPMEVFPRAPREGDLPLSFAQQRLWVLEQIDPGSPLYHIAGAVCLAGRLDVDALHRCLNEVVRRHESLRATFYEKDGKAVQRIAPPAPLDLPLIDLSGLPDAGRDDHLRRLMVTEARRPFDVTRGPLLRAMLVRLGDDAHVVVLVVHHIAADGWSFEILLRDIGALYPAFAAGRPSPLPEPAIQYADYAVWQRERLRGDTPAGGDGDADESAATPLQSDLAYWRRRLAGAPPLLDLPTDRPRPVVQSHNGARLDVELPAPLSATLRAFACNENVTLFTVLLAGLNGLLLRYAGQEDVCIGMPVAGRTHRLVEDVVGFFVNTLVLRTDLSGSPSFRETVRRVQRVLIEALAHQEAPFELVVDAVQPERTLAYAPLFQVMADMQRDSLQRFDLPDLTLTPLMVDVGVAKFDLTFSFVEHGDGLRCSIEYNIDLFDEATIARMARHFQTLLEGAVADPDQTLDRLPLLTPDERRLLVAWNATDTPFPADRCVHELFAAQMARTPDTLALICDDARLTYADLDRRANQLAHYLRRWGVGPERLAGICLERSLDLIVAILAVLKAGGAYMPLDPAYPAERLRFMIDDASPTLILSYTTVTALPATCDLPVLQLDAQRIWIDGEPIVPPVNQAHPDNLAYVIYTSGSTGLPKGVLLQHRGLTNLATAYQRDFDLGPGSRVLQFFAFSFDGSVADIFMALLSGATLCLPGRDTLRSPDDLTHFMQEHGVTLATLPPAMLALLDPDALPSLTTVISAGESVTPALARRWAKGRRFINAYGPTEATVAASWYDATDLPSDAATVPIGRPLANTHLYVLSPALQPAPIGVAGELYIGGVGVARGYLNRDDLTAARFLEVSGLLDDPAAPDSRCRVYRTGDRVRWRADGNLEFLGRFDDQVKIRGFRIELGEVEAALRAHPEVQDAAAVVREDQPGIRRLAAYVTPAGAPIVDIRAWLADRLPEHMIPAVFVSLAALPLSPSGKVDRRALPPPVVERTDAADEDSAPRGDVEATLAAIWREVLGGAQVGRDDNFFALGGDSILSIQVVARARQAGIHITPRAMFQARTLAELARLAEGAAPVRAEQGVITGAVPLTPIQRWFFDQNLPNPHHWNQAVLLALPEALDATALTAAVQALLAQHDMLRVRFAPADDGWRQTIAPPDGEPPVWWRSLAEVDAADLAAAITRECAAAQASLHLERGPVVRVVHLNLGAGRGARLLLAVHHLVIDAVSWGPILNDLQTAYAQARTAQPIRLPPKTSSYRSWAERLVAYAQSDALMAELPFWLAQQGKSLPVDMPGGENREGMAETVRATLDPETTDALIHELPDACGVEINDLLLTALAVAVARTAGLRGCLIEVEHHGRNDGFDDLDLSRTVGWFTCLYPLYLGVPESDDLPATLQSVRAQRRRVPNHGLGYSVLRYLGDAAVQRQLADAAEPTISFNYLGQIDALFRDMPDLRIADEPAGAQCDPSGQRPRALAINGGIAGGQLRLDWTYSAGLHRRATVERLIDAFLAALRTLVASHRAGADLLPKSPDMTDVALSDHELAALLAEIG